MMTAFRTLLLSTATALALPAAALAQTTTTQTAPQVSEAAASEPAEIVVTAQKRAERLQDVPVAVSVLSGDAIANQGGINIENAQYLVPSLNFRKSGTTLNQFLFLRGIGTANFSIAAEPSVSAVLDGVVLSTAGEAFGDLVDIERVEVLRGPQGTLFGKNASAGVINIVSKRPGTTPGGYLEGGWFFGNGNEYRVRGAADLPLSGTVRSRFTAFYGTYDGNIFNAAPNVNRRVNGYERYGVRGIVEADAGERLRFTLIGDYRKANDPCCAELIGTVPTNLAASVIGQFAQGAQTRTISQNLITRTQEESYGGSLQADLDVGAAGTITSITAQRWFYNREIRDGDWLPQAYGNPGLNQLHDDGPQNSKTFSQELRLTSPGRQFVDYVLGAFYSRNTNERTFTRSDIVCGLLPTAPAGTLVPCGSANATPSTFPLGTANFGSTFKNYAAFGQVTVNVAEGFRLIGGLRWTRDELDVFHIRRTTLAGPGIGGNFDQGVADRYAALLAANPALDPNVAVGQSIAGSNGVPWRASSRKENLSGRAGVQVDLTPNNTAYATYARGYKGPAFNVFFNMNGLSTNPVAAETADSFEVGLKNTLADGRLVLNVAGFYAKYKNFQANNPDLVNGVVTTRLTNAGTVSTRGVELDIIARPSDDWSITGGFAYTNARVDAFRLPPGALPTQVIPSGTPLTSAPKVKLSLSSDRRFVTGGFADLAIGTTVAYTSTQLTQLSPDPVVRVLASQPGYMLVDAQVALVDPNDTWRLSFLVRNLFDQAFGAAIQTGGPGGSYRYQIPREADRYFGLTLRVNLGR